ncbi:hypothetical protein EFR01_42200 [Sinorhizobium fredii]|nr:hypothetical protein EFR01_42200 [Sinorhizobium fredii]
MLTDLRAVDEQRLQVLSVAVTGLAEIHVDLSAAAARRKRRQDSRAWKSRPEAAWGVRLRRDSIGSNHPVSVSH